MFQFLRLLILASCVARVSLAPEVVVPSYDTVSQFKNIFLLAGQSNMAGRGGVVNETVWDRVVPPECAANPSILRLSAGLQWVEAQEPLHADIDVNKTCGVGPGLSFANDVLSQDQSLGVVGLVPCAIGGTRIQHWSRGTFLYNQLLTRARAAVQGGGGGAIQALLWYQGESDTETEEDAKSYKTRLQNFFTNIRFDLQFPQLPIIQVALASGEGKYVERVREAQLGIELVNVKCIDAEGLALNDDNLHLTTASQVRLGQMFAAAYLQTRPVLSPVNSGTGFTQPKGIPQFCFSIVFFMCYYYALISS